MMSPFQSLPSISGYELIAPLGDTFHATVYKAINDKGEECALKVFKKHDFNKRLITQIITHFEEEDNTHPTILVPIHRLQINQSPIYLESPLLLNAKDEPACIKHLDLIDPQFRANKGYYIISLLANHLSSLHLQEAFHGNLKPSNLFMVNEDELLLNDYGLVCNLRGSYQIPHKDWLYLAPEQLTNLSLNSIERLDKVDIYSFGIIAYQLMTGQLPWGLTYEMLQDFKSPEGLQNYLAKTKKLEWPEDPHLSVFEEKRRHLVEKCLEFDFHVRPKDMSYVSLEWNQITINEQHSNIKHTWKKRLIKNWILVTFLVAASISLSWYAYKFHTEWQMEKQRSEAVHKMLQEYTIDSESTQKEKMAILYNSTTLKEKLEQDKQNIKDAYSKQLKLSWELSDQLFYWLLNHNSEQLPTLEANTERIATLKEHIDKLNQTVETTHYQDQLAPFGIKLPLIQAEMALAENNSTEAYEHLKKIPKINAYQDDKNLFERNLRAHYLLASLWLEEDKSLEATRIFEAIITTLLNYTNTNNSHFIQVQRILALSHLALGEYHLNSTDISKAANHLQSGIALLQNYSISDNPYFIIQRQWAESSNDIFYLSHYFPIYKNSLPLKQDTIKVLQQLQEKQPNVPLFKITEGQIIAEQAYEAFFDANYTQSIALFDESLKTLKNQIIDDPSLQQLQQLTIADTLSKEALLHIKKYRNKEALSCLNEAIKIASAIPEVSNYTFRKTLTLSQAHARLSIYHGHTLNTTAELDELEQAINTLKSIKSDNLKKHQKNFIQQQQAIYYYDLAYLAKKKNRITQGKLYLAESKKLWKSLIKENPQEKIYQEGLANVESFSI